jgi:hypothetical protein
MAIEISSWMRQNMKKSGGSSAAGSMKKAVVRMADGGDVSEAEDKAAGLAASSGEKVGFFERLRMGSIDDPKSEAYSRFGAGRAKADRDMENEAAAMRTVDQSRAEAAKAARDDADFAEMDRQIASGRSVTGTEPKPPAPAPVAKPKPRPARNAVRASAAAPTTSSSASLAQRLGKEYADLENAARRAEDMPDATPESRRMVRKLADDKRRAFEAAAAAEKDGRSVVLRR